MKKFIHFIAVILFFIAAIPLQAQYCVPNVDVANSFGAGITNVTFNSLNRNSGTGESFAVHTETTSVQQGSAQSFSITTDVGTFCTQMNVRVYIDYDQSFTFDTLAGEEAVTINSVGSGTQAATINIPAGAATGSTRMRVMIKMVPSCGHSSIEPCGSDTGPAAAYHGEVEDYDITITSGTGITEAGEKAKGLMVYSTNDHVQIEYALATKADVTLEIFNVLGQKVNTVASSSQQQGNYWYKLNRSELNPSNIYFAKLSVDGISFTRKFMVR